MTNSHTHICITYKHRGFVNNLQFSFDEEYMWPAVLEHYYFDHLNTEQGSDGLQVQVYSTDVHHLSVFLLTCRFCNQALRSKGLASSSCSRMCIIWFHEWQRRGEESISAIVLATAYIHMTEASYLAGCFIGCTKFKHITLLHYLSGLPSKKNASLFISGVGSIIICMKIRCSEINCFWTWEANCWNTYLWRCYWLSTGEKVI